ncbi:hypothetical protein KIAC18_003945 [Sporomusa sphaeroides]|uniref:hypothetical protein n=1 Tax=Sporomusa sphaeroides TaxID=47679 RepID=UPI003DA14FBF
MVSDLYWRMGFGQIHAGLLIISLIATFYSKGTFRFLFAAVAIILLIFAWYRYQRWNGTPWRKVHGRGMLLYASCAGLEQAKATSEGRRFSIENACYDLAEKMCGQDKILEVMTMIGDLQDEQGLFLQDLILTNFHYVAQKSSPDSIHALAQAAESVKFGPHLVIANIIYNTHGPHEATRYAIALLKGDAH